MNVSIKTFIYSVFYLNQIYWELCFTSLITKCCESNDFRIVVLNFELQNCTNVLALKKPICILYIPWWNMSRPTIKTKTPSNHKHGVWKSQKKYHSTLRAKRATFTFWVNKSWLKMPKKFHFGEFLKTWSLRSISVTRQVSFNRTKIGGKF